MKREDTAIWQVIEGPTQSLPMQQPVTNITYNVNISGVAGWLTVLAQMPATTVWAGAAVVGVLGAVVVSTLLMITAIAMQFIVGLTIAVVVAIVALASMAVIVKG